MAAQCITQSLIVVHFHVQLHAGLRCPVNNIHNEPAPCTLGMLLPLPTCLSDRPCCQLSRSVKQRALPPHFPYQIGRKAAGLAIASGVCAYLSMLWMSCTTSWYRHVDGDIRLDSMQVIAPGIEAKLPAVSRSCMTWWRHQLVVSLATAGMWTATRAELKRFMASEYWSKAGALAAKLEKADYQKPNPYMYGNWCVHGSCQRWKKQLSMAHQLD